MESCKSSFILKEKKIVWRCFFYYFSHETPILNILKRIFVKIILLLLFATAVI